MNNKQIYEKTMTEKKHEMYSGSDFSVGIFRFMRFNQAPLVTVCSVNKALLCVVGFFLPLDLSAFFLFLFYLIPFFVYKFSLFAHDSEILILMGGNSGMWLLLLVKDLSRLEEQ